MENSMISLDQKKLKPDYFVSAFLRQPSVF